MFFIAFIIIANACGDGAGAPQTALDNPYLASHVQLGSSVGLWGLWNVLVGSEGFWTALEGSGIFSRVLECSGALWRVLMCSGGLSKAHVESAPIPRVYRFQNKSSCRLLTTLSVAVGAEQSMVQRYPNRVLS